MVDTGFKFACFSDGYKNYWKVTGRGQLLPYIKGKGYTVQQDAKGPVYFIEKIKRGSSGIQVLQALSRYIGMHGGSWYVEAAALNKEAK